MKNQLNKTGKELVDIEVINETVGKDMFSLCLRYCEMKAGVVYVATTFQITEENDPNLVK